DGGRRGRRARRRLAGVLAARDRRRGRRDAGVARGAYPGVVDVELTAGFLGDELVVRSEEDVDAGGVRTEQFDGAGGELERAAAEGRDVVAVGEEVDVPLAVLVDVLGVDGLPGF